MSIGKNKTAITIRQAASLSEERGPVPSVGFIRQSGIDS